MYRFPFNAELPSYDIGNLRWGIRTDRWEGSLYVNNLWDERAFLSVDRERGRSARVGYLTNPPRTYGVNFPHELLIGDIPAVLADRSWQTGTHLRASS